MWAAPTYFGPGYFGPTYFGLGGATEGDDSHCFSRWIIWPSGGSRADPVYDTGWVADDLTNHTPPSGTLLPGTGYCAVLMYMSCDGCEREAEEVCFNTVGVARICPSHGCVKWVAIRDGPRCEVGSTRLAFIPEEDWSSIVMLEEVMGRESLEFGLPRESSVNSDYWQYLVERNWLELVYDDDAVGNPSYSEWLIVTPVDRRGDQDELTAKIEAEGPMAVLAENTDRRIEEDGRVVYSFGLNGLLPIDHLDFILNDLPDPIDWMVVGSVESVERISLDYDNSNRLGMIQALSETLSLERQVQRNEELNYAVQIVEEVGSECPVPTLRYAKNNRAIQRRVDTSELGTRVHPLGAERDGVRGTIGEAAWLVVAVVPNPAISATAVDVYLEGTPFLFDEMLNEFYAEQQGTELRWLVLDTFWEEQYVTLDGGSELLPFASAIIFRLDAVGTQMTYLQNPLTAGIGPLATKGTGPGQGTYGVVDPPQDALDDVPSVDNIAANPFITDWTTVEGVTTPNDWFPIGAATIEQESRRQFVLNGQFSAHVVMPGAGDGMESGWLPVFPNERPDLRYLSLQSAFFLIEGKIEMRLIVDNGTEQFTVPDPALPEDKRAVSTATGVWTTNLAVAGLDAWDDLGAKFVKIQVVALDDAAEVYWDAVQLSQTPSGNDEFLEGLGSQLLWYEGLRYLALYSEPEVSYEINLVDLERLEPAQYPEDELNIGAGANIIDNDPLGIQDNLRIMALKRDMVHCGITDVTVSNIRQTLTRFLALERKGRRRSIIRTEDGGGGDDGGDSTDCGGQIGGLGVVLENNDPSQDFHILSWVHNTCVQSNPFQPNPAGMRFWLDIYETIVDLDDGTVLQDSSLKFSLRDPRTDRSGSDDTINSGIAEIPVDFIGMFGSPDSHRFTYRVELFDNSALVMTRLVNIQGHYSVPE